MTRIPARDSGARRADGDLERLVADHDAVVLYQDGHHDLPGVPGRAGFATFAPELWVWSDALVRCDYFGDALGVFAKPGVTTLDGPGGRVDAAEIARQLESAAPGQIHCATG